jgi:hypothetical protein
MSDLEAMDNEIDELADEIGMSVARLQQLLQKDERYIDQLIALGRSREFAERASFIGDMRNVLGLMASHNFSAHTAARMIGQTPENPVEISTTEEEDEDEEDEQPRTPSSRDDESDDSSQSSWEDSQSSEDEPPTVQAKRVKRDPDYYPSSDEDEEEEEEDSQ